LAQLSCLAERAPERRDVQGHLSILELERSQCLGEAGVALSAELQLRWRELAARLRFDGLHGGVDRFDQLAALLGPRDALATHKAAEGETTDPQPREDWGCQEFLSTLGAKRAAGNRDKPRTWRALIRSRKLCFFRGDL